MSASSEAATPPLLRRLLTAGGVLALLGAALLLAVPQAVPGPQIGWDPGTGLGDGGPFDVTVAIDAYAGEIRPSDPSLASVRIERAEGSRIDVVGNSGRGRIVFEGLSPSGRVLISDIVGPDDYFTFPPDPETPEWLRVTVEPAEATLPAPGGRLVAVVTVANPASNPGPVTVKAISFEGGYAPHSDRDDSCLFLELPQTLSRLASLRCTLAIDVHDRVGREHRFTLGALKADGDYWDTQVVIRIGPAGSVAPAEPAPVSGDPGVSGPAPVREVIVLDEPGPYTLRMTSEGSEGFSITLFGQGSGWWRLNREVIGAGLAVGIALAAAGVLALAASRSRRTSLAAVGELGLAAAALMLPVALLASSDHGWYWRPWAHLVWIPSLSVAALGGLAWGHTLLRPRQVPVAGVAVTAALFITGPIVLAVAASSFAYGYGFIGGGWPTYYGGDYLNMWFHVVGLLPASIALTLNGWLLGWGTAPAVAPPRRHAGAHR